MSKISEVKREKTRKKIVDAASELFSKHGFHNTQVMDIVKAVGMSAGTFYNYYKDKKDLFEQVIMQNFEVMRHKIKELRQPLNISDRQDRLKKIRESWTTFFDYLDNNPQQVLMLLRSSFGVDELFDLNIWEQISVCARDLADDVQKWIDEGLMEGIKPVLLGHAIVGMAMQIAHSYLVENKFTRDEAIEALVNMSMAMFDMYTKEAEG